MEKETREIRLSDGRYLIAVLRDGLKFGVLIRDTRRKHVVGNRPRGRIEEALPGDIVVWLEKLESARIIADTFAHAILLMQGVVPIPVETENSSDAGQRR